MSDARHDSSPDDAQDILDLLAAHRSIRKYKNTPIPEPDIEAAIRAGQAASTSSAVQACTVIQVTQAADRAALVPLTGGQTKVLECGAFFVICGDVRRHRLLVERAGGQYHTRFEAFLVAVIDAALFAQNMAIAFEAMGYGICFIGGLRNDLRKVRELLEIPVGVYPLYGLCAGVRDEHPSARPRLPISAVFCKDRYPDDQDMLAMIDEYDDVYRQYLRDRKASPEAIDRAWAGIMANKYTAPERSDVASFYRQQGADLT